MRSGRGETTIPAIARSTIAGDSDVTAVCRHLADTVVFRIRDIEIAARIYGQAFWLMDISADVAEPPSAYTQGTIAGDRADHSRRQYTLRTRLLPESAIYRVPAESITRPSGW